MACGITSDLDFKKGGCVTKLPMSRYFFSFQQNYRYLDLLNVLCVCDGVAIQNNQTYITEHWLRRDRVSIVSISDTLRKIVIAVHAANVL